MILAVNAWVFYRNMRPLYTLLKWLENYRLGSKREPLDESLRIVEFRKLNEAANLFSERSEQLYEQQNSLSGMPPMRCRLRWPSVATAGDADGG